MSAISKNDTRLANHPKVLRRQRPSCDFRRLRRTKAEFLDDVADLTRCLAGVDLAFLKATANSRQGALDEGIATHSQAIVCGVKAGVSR